MTAPSRLVACLAALALPAAVRADPPTPTVRASLAWVRADGAAACPDAAALRAALARRLGYDPTVDPAAPSVSVEAVVSRASLELPWSVALYERAPDGALLGERHLELRADTCAPIVDAVALAVAASLDGDALARAIPEPPPPAPPPPAPVAPPPASPPVVVAPPPPRPRVHRWSVAATALGGAALGTLPSVTPLAALVVEVRPPSWPTLVVTGLYQPDASVDLRVGSATMRLALAGLAVCPWRTARASLSLSLCAGTLAGALVAAGHGLTVDRIEERPYVALEAGARARWSFGRYVHLAADVHAVVPLVRDTLVVDGIGDVVRVAPIGLRATIGVGVHFE